MFSSRCDGMHGICFNYSRGSGLGTPLTGGCIFYGGGIGKVLLPSYIWIYMVVSNYVFHVHPNLVIILGMS